MDLNFDSSGNLYETVDLSFEDFQNHFGTNESRKRKIKTALTFLKIFRSCGCNMVYIGGSFVTPKANPEDIDLCFDISTVDFEKLKKEFPEFFDYNKLGIIRKNLKCHIFYFDAANTYLLEMLREDRNGNPKGLVKLILKDILNYDQE